MLCPKCSAYLLESDFEKENVLLAPGAVPVEYDARCPLCRVIIGKMFWGKLTLSPQFAVAAEPADPPAQSEAKVCPHCGKPLPEDY